MQKIKIGQIGVGHGHAKGKMEVYRRSDDFEVVGIVEPDEKLREAVQRDPVFRDLEWMTTEELFNTPGLKAVAIETRVSDLLETAETCINAGMHVHLDKPAGASLPQFRRILETAASKHLAVQMGYMYRYNPAVQLMHDILQKGWLGEPFEVQTVMSKVVRPDDRRQLAEFSGGMMFELGCHIIDLTVAVLGRPDEVHSFAQHAAPIDDGLADNVLAVCTYPRAIASIKSSAQEIEGTARRQFTVCGTEGTLHIQPLDAPNVRLALDRDRGDYRRGYQEIPFGNYSRYVGDAIDLAQVIRGEKDAAYGYGHDLAVQETVLKASGMPLDA